MGQNVNYLLGNQQQLLGADPELYRQQLVQQEQQRIGALAPNLQLGAQLGNLLGRGVTNAVQGRGFFEVTNPVLQKLTQVQDVYNTSLKNSDPNDPLSFYTNLQKNFAEAGLGQQSMMAAVEAKKFEQSNLKTEAARTELYKNNLPLLQADINKFREAGDDAKADQLTSMYGRFQAKETRAEAVQNAEILYKQAATESQRAQADKLRSDAKEGKIQIVQTVASLTQPAMISVYRDGKLESQSAVGERLSLSPSGAGSGGTSKERRPLGAALNTQAAPTPAATQPSPVPNTMEIPNPEALPADTGAPVPIASTATPMAAQAGTGPLAPNGVYYAARDPVLLSLKQMIASDPGRLGRDKAYFDQIIKARNDQVAILQQKYGNMVNFEGL